MFFLLQAVCAAALSVSASASSTEGSHTNVLACVLRAATLLPLTQTTLGSRGAPRSFEIQKDLIAQQQKLKQ